MRPSAWQQQHESSGSAQRPQVLAEHDEFPCAVIRTTDGYRVTFAALVRILRPRRGEPAPGAGSSSERR